MIHYAALGEERTACDLPCRAPTDAEHSTKFAAVGVVTSIRSFSWSRSKTEASLDPRRVDCPTCIANMPEVPLCECGAPALYGRGAREFAAKVGGYQRIGHDDALYCAEHCPDDCKCQQCGRPLMDASESFCQGCLDATDEDNGHDGITEYSDPAGVGGSAAY